MIKELEKFCIIMLRNIKKIIILDIICPLIKHKVSY